MLPPLAPLCPFARTTFIAAALLAACSAPLEPADSATPMHRTTPVEFTGVRRVGGDLAVKSAREPGVGVDGADAWSAGPARITTALPVGYPDPTPPGAIELKHYPSVRRAEVSGNGNPDLGRNLAFWPLFGHIQKREIAMTSPVEMDYPAPAGPSSAPGEWTMSFLYRDASLGELGSDGNVRIVDQPAMTVLSLGMLGDYSYGGGTAASARLLEWLAAQSEWEIAGRPRALYYNGPEKRSAEKWAEIQIPVRPVARMQATDLDLLIGEPWSGTLTYLDYTSGETTAIRSSLSVQRTRSSGAWNLAIGYSDEPQEDTSDVVAISADGRKFADESVVERRVEPDGSIRVVTECDSTDNGLPVRMRHVYVIGERACSLQKLVRGEGDRGFIERHVYRWARENS